MDFPKLSSTLISKLKKIPYVYHLDYNYKEGDIILCHTSYYTFFRVTEAGTIHAYDAQGYSTFLKANEISGSIATDDYPELFLW